MYMNILCIRTYLYKQYLSQYIKSLYTCALSRRIHIFYENTHILHVYERSIYTNVCIKTKFITTYQGSIYIYVCPMYTYTHTLYKDALCMYIHIHIRIHIHTLYIYIKQKSSQHIKDLFIYRALEIIIDLPIGFPINNIISLSIYIECMYMYT